MRASKRAARLLKILITASLLAAVFSYRSEAAEMDLAQGKTRRGSVTVMEKKGVLFIAIEEAMTRLAFAATPSTGGFVVTYSGKKIEFWNGSNAARVNGTVHPLAASVTYEDGHWWGEAVSSLQAIKLFLTSVSRPSDIALVNAAPRPDPPRNLPAAPATAPAASPQRTAAETPVLEQNTSSESGAVIERVRWGEQPSAYRAVVDVSERTEAVYSEKPGAVEVTFAGASAGDLTAKSPWPGLSVASRKNGNDVVLSFAHTSASAKGFWVTDPPRYVVDFYFAGGAAPGAEENAGATSASERETGTAMAAAAPGRIETKPKPQVSRERAKEGKRLVVVDAGHGGHDGGAVGNGLKEKDMNLLAALQLGISLKALGMDVRLTRIDDRYLKLSERTEIANNSNADIFISLHCNALPKGKHASGAELYLMAEQTDQDALNLAIIENRELSGGAESARDVDEAADKRTRLLLKILGDMQQSDKINESTTLAEFLYEKMKSSGFQIRKVRQAPFFVLRGAGMPAVLVEMGYISEAADAKKLNSQPNRKKMMDALAAGIAGYLGSDPVEGGKK